MVMSLVHSLRSLLTTSLHSAFNYGQTCLIDYIKYGIPIPLNHLHSPSGWVDHEAAAYSDDVRSKETNRVGVGQEYQGRKGDPSRGCTST